MQLYVHLTHKNVVQAFDRFQNWLDDVKMWLSANKLEINLHKREFNILGSKKQCEKRRGSNVKKKQFPLSC